MSNDITPQLKIYFHTDESYYPSSFDFFIDGSTLYDKSGSKDLFKSQPELMQKVCPNGRKDYILKANKDDLKYGMNDTLNQVPIYKFTRTYNGKKYIIYSLFYPYNGEYNILGIQETGQHWGDAEHITFELNDDNSVSRIYFGAHGDSDGKWVLPSQVDKENDEYVAYVAYHGHGFYPKQGTYFRNYGTSNDYTNKGKSISTKTNPIIEIRNKDVLNDEEKNKVGLAYFCGQIGEDGIDSYYRKGWFNNLDKEENPPPLVNNTLFVVGRAIVFLLLFYIIYKLFMLGNKIPNYSMVYYIVFIIIFIYGIIKLKEIIKSFS